MWGAIVGDIVGSSFEFKPIKTKDFELFSPGCSFTDDTVMTVAVSEALLTAAGEESRGDKAMVEAMRRWGHAYPHPKGGYGGRFAAWLRGTDSRPYGSFGNGSAMRVSPVAWYFSTLADVERWAEISARVTHNHPEGIRGAQATASSIFLARTGVTQGTIREYVADRFGYDLSRTLADIRPGYRHDQSCQGTVPEAITAFLASRDFEDAVRGAISLGGDSDTLGAIAGAIAEAAYGIPPQIQARAVRLLDPPLLAAVERFEAVVRGAKA
jgi:ADP-ribosylglycohydrolase